MMNCAPHSGRTKFNFSKLSLVAQSTYGGGGRTGFPSPLHPSSLRRVVSGDGGPNVPSAGALNRPPSQGAVLYPLQCGETGRPLYVVSSPARGRYHRVRIVLSW